MSREQQQGENESRSSLIKSVRGGIRVLVHDLAITIIVAIIIGVLLFAGSGVWPPLVAVESGSMEPHLEKGDLVFVSEPGRYAPDDTFRDTGIVPAEMGREIDYRSFSGYGSTVVYSPPGWDGSPIIHRAHFWVEEGENWYEKADPDHVQAENCRELQNCPAPQAGFITKGDNNPRYDQAVGVPPVRPDWIEGTAHVRIPYLGRIRLIFGLVTSGPPTVFAGQYQ